MTTSPASGSDLRHEAFFYQHVDDYAAVVGDFLTGALETDRHVLVAVSGERAETLAGRLGGSWDQVEVIDMAELGRNPSRIIPAFRSFLDKHQGQEASLVGEPIWPGRTAAEISEATRHEALVNSALAGTAVHALCPYHVSSLDDAVIADACRTHPVLHLDGRTQASRDFAEPETVWRSAALEPAESHEARTVDFDLSGLPAVRKAVRAEAARAGLDEERRDDLVVATSEVVGNSIRHGGGSGVLYTWLEPDAVVCEVRDRGEITDPLAGRLRPDLAADGGWGLWLANQVCDLVQLHTGPDGTTVRLRVTR